MGNRLELQAKLEQLVGNKNVYFQPPASVSLSYPCVIYSLGNGEALRANNKLYRYVDRYDVIFIYKRPMTDLIERVLEELPMCNISRVYVSDNLNHYAFNLYY